MRRKSKTFVAAGAAAAVLATPAGAAAVPQPGLRPIGPVTLTQAQPVRAIDVTTGATLVCGSSTAHGEVPQIQPPNLIIHSATFSTPGNPNGWCDGSGGIFIQVTAANFPWTYTVASFDAGTGVATGTLTGIEVQLHASDGCDVTISGPGGTPGEVAGTVTNGTGEFAITGNLKVTEADFECDPSLINVGDTIVVGASFASTPPLSYSSL